ncbi:MAG: hypothetical protein CMP49_05230 [Flavobacteriales bacterium]|nr:hypothetical protein [Flavobacteriales bacterium]|tara:strand:- start:17410 stop:18198 length:789 start_codon:yes stop_codon:yes gene_type:complete
MIHYVLILAAGKGSRLKNSQIPKQFLLINNLPIIMHSILAFKDADPSCKIYIALPKNYLDFWKKLCKNYNFKIKHKIYIGGNSRTSSVWNGLEKINQEKIVAKQLSKSTKSNHFNDIVSIHDAARPFIDKKLILNLIKIAKKKGIAIPAIKLKNSLRKISLENSSVNLAQDRRQYIITQTPQVFYLKDIYDSYIKINYEFAKYNDNDILDSKYLFDDAGIYEASKTEALVNIEHGREYNIKITTDLDYLIAPTIYEFVKNLK